MIILKRFSQAECPSCGHAIKKPVDNQEIMCNNCQSIVIEDSKRIYLIRFVTLFIIFIIPIISVASFGITLESSMFHKSLAISPFWLLAFIFYYKTKHLHIKLKNNKE